jgi:hypothetical protein
MFVILRWYAYTVDILDSSVYYRESWFVFDELAVPVLFLMGV